MESPYSGSMVCYAEEQKKDMIASQNTDNIIYSLKNCKQFDVKTLLDIDIVSMNDLAHSGWQYQTNEASNHFTDFSLMDKLIIEVCLKHKEDNEAKGLYFKYLVPLSNAVIVNLN